MNMCDFYVAQIVLLMREYQEQNNIKNNCSTNTQYLYDCITKNFPKTNVKACAVIVVSNNIIVAGHLAILLDDNIIIEPSNDIFIKTNKLYYNNLNIFLKEYNYIDKDFLKDICNKYLDFVKLSNKINKGSILINDKDYYDSQADYIENKLKYNI